MKVERWDIRQAPFDPVFRHLKTVQTTLKTGEAFMKMEKLSDLQLTNENDLTADLAALGYPGFSYLKPRRPERNPAELLFAALNQRHLDSRLAEALPWVVWQFPQLDWQWLTAAARQSGLQNRLGFVVSVARDIAEQHAEDAKAAWLANIEATLEPVRLAQEDTLCHDRLTRAEQVWLREHRSPAARHWGLLTDLTAQHLDYAA